MASTVVRHHRHPMITVRIDNAVQDYGQWKAAFDSYAAVRERMGVLNFRISRPIDDDQRILIELDFDQRSAAEDFIEFLIDKVWRTPRSQTVLAHHNRPELLEAVERWSKATATASPERA
jgi:hypothetical protein